MHDLSEESGTLVDANFRRIFPESVFIPHVSTRYVVGTANTVIASQTGYLETQESVGTILFPVRTRFDGDGCTRTATCETLCRLFREAIKHSVKKGGKLMRTVEHFVKFRNLRLSSRIRNGVHVVTRRATLLRFATLQHNLT